MTLNKQLRASWGDNINAISFFQIQRLDHLCSSKRNGIWVRKHMFDPFLEVWKFDILLIVNYILDLILFPNTSNAPTNFNFFRCLDILRLPAILKRYFFNFHEIHFFIVIKILCAWLRLPIFITVSFFLFFCFF